ncbi:hypothetical protein AURDEDRAFT_167775 [Auricularia subglabra TFB-10046 SS5]|nr:hypothetical protein AURDEDRAFT_167775 [Auricularia subglabra TFB-10046 SS5]
MRNHARAAGVVATLLRRTHSAAAVSLYSRSHSASAGPCTPEAGHVIHLARASSPVRVNEDRFFRAWNAPCNVRRALDARLRRHKALPALSPDGDATGVASRPGRPVLCMWHYEFFFLSGADVQSVWHVSLTAFRRFSRTKR